jgi:hypothetical protein
MEKTMMEIGERYEQDILVLDISGDLTGNVDESDVRTLGVSFSDRCRDLINQDRLRVIADINIDFRHEANYWRFLMVFIAGLKVLREAGGEMKLVSQYEIRPRPGGPGYHLFAQFATVDDAVRSFEDTKTSNH